MKVLVRNYSVYSNLAKKDPLFTLKILWVNSFVTREWVATEGKNNIVYEIDCSNGEASVYFGEYKRSFKSRSDEHKRSVRNCDCEKNETVKHSLEADHNFSCDPKKVVDRESRLITKKIKETIHSLKNPNHINENFYILPEVWLPNLQKLLVS